MIRLQIALDLDYEISDSDCDFIFNIHAARTQRQHVLSESLSLSQEVPAQVETDPATLNRYLRVHARPGPLRLSYRATIDLLHHFASPEEIAEVPIARLPAPVLSYIYPSRYCQSDRLHQMAMREFGQRWQGYSRVQAIRDWVLQRTTFASNTSNSNTSAVDTLRVREAWGSAVGGRRLQELRDRGGGLKNRTAWCVGSLSGARNR